MALARHVIGFLAVGGAATALQYALLVVFVEAFGVNAVLASSLAYALSALANYFANRRFTFQSDAVHSHALPRFALMATCGLALNAFVMWLVYSLLGVNYLLSQVTATGVTLAWNFVLSRYWIFAAARS